MSGEGLSFELPSLLSAEHDTSPFDSGEPVLDEWLRLRAWKNQQLAASNTYVLCPAGGLRVAGYAAISVTQIQARDAIGSIRRNMPPAIPGILLGRLAIDRSYQGQDQGLGTALLAHVIQRARQVSRIAAVRLVVVHAISPAATAFYLRHGFTQLPLPTPTLALDLIKLDKMRSEMAGE